MCKRLFHLCFTTERDSEASHWCGVWAFAKLSAYLYSHCKVCYSCCLDYFCVSAYINPHCKMCKSCCSNFVYDLFWVLLWRQESNWCYLISEVWQTKTRAFSRQYLWKPAPPISSAGIWSPWRLYNTKKCINKPFGKSHKESKRSRIQERRASGSLILCKIFILIQSSF